MRATFDVIFFCVALFATLEFGCEIQELGEQANNCYLHGLFNAFLLSYAAFNIGKHL